jgi:hypothetical protein
MYSVKPTSKRTVFYNELTGKTTTEIPEGASEDAVRAFRRGEIDLTRSRPGLKSRVLLQASDPPMLQINRLIKASWEWCQAIRRFTIAACYLKYTISDFNPPMKSTNEVTPFFIQCPPFSPTVCKYLRDLMHYIFNIHCLILDMEGKLVESEESESPANGTSMLFDPCSTSISFDKVSEDQSTLLNYVIYFMFGYDKGLIGDLVDHSELSLPENVSYAYPHAVGSHEISMERVRGPAQKRPENWGLMYGKDPEHSRAIAELHALMKDLDT